MKPARITHLTEASAERGAAMPPASGSRTAFAGTPQVPGASPADHAAAMANARRQPPAFDPSVPSPSQRIERQGVHATPPYDEVDIAILGDRSALRGIDWTAIGWRFPQDNEPFAVTRFYPGDEPVAVDYPHDWRDVERVETKRAIIEGQGIAYVAVMPGEALDREDVLQRLEESRARIAKTLVPA